MPNHPVLYPVPDDICEERRYSLKKALEAADMHDRELAEQLVRHEREMRQQEFRSRDAELILQAKADEVHFATLNGNLARIIEERKSFLTRDAMDDFLKTYSTFRDDTRNELTRIRTWGAAGLLCLGILEFWLRFALK